MLICLRFRGAYTAFDASDITPLRYVDASATSRALPRDLRRHAAMLANTLLTLRHFAAATFSLMPLFCFRRFAIYYATRDAILRHTLAPCY